MKQPTEYYGALPANNIRDILKGSGPQINSIKHFVDGGEHLVKALLTKELEGLNSFFNVPQMTAQQRIETINLACETYFYWKLEDFKLVFKKAKMEQKLYNRIDGGIIFELFRAHDNDRTEMAGILSKESEPKDTKPNPEGQKKVLEILRENLVASKYKPEKKGKVKSEYDLICQEALTEFDRLYTAGKGTNGTRFVKVNGAMMDQTEFMAYKLKQKGL